jgi:tight adherence protein B
MDLHLAISIVLGFAIFLIFFGLDRIYANQTSTIESRLDRYAARQVAVALPNQPNLNQPKANRLNRFLAASAGSQIATELARADLKLTVSEYVLMNVASTLIGFLLAMIIFRGDAAWLLAVAGGAAGFYFPRWYLRYLQGKRVAAFNSQLSDTIVLLSNSLRSGYSLLQSMETVSKELSAPMSTEFARVTREIGLGLTIQEALANLLRRIPSEDLDMMITAINIQHEVGGNLAEILDTIAFTIRERVRITGEIRSITAQQRLSATMLSVLPILLGLVLYALNPTYISRLWQDMCGWIMLIVGGVMIVAGYLVIRKIVSIEV